MPYGRALPNLPPVWTADGKVDTRFPTTLPNRPFRIDAPPVSKGLDQIVPSPIHQFWQNQEQIAGGFDGPAGGGLHATLGSDFAADAGEEIGAGTRQLFRRDILAKRRAHHLQL